MGEPLAQIITRQVNYAYQLLNGVGKSPERYDRLSSSRSSIAHHEQDYLRRDECLSCLIDILRDILYYWIDSKPTQARQHADLWWSSKLPLLMRFAAYARTRDPQYTADERIEWILGNDLVFRSGMKKEVFDILKFAYPHTSSSVRSRLLRRIERGDRGRDSKYLDQETLAYEKFNVLVWLSRSDPECTLAKSAISAIVTMHPRFGAREYPEFDSWHGDAKWVDPTEGVDFNRIISRPPEEIVKELLSSDNSFARRDLWSCLQSLAKLFNENKDWGRGFVEALARETTSSEEVWNAVFWGLRDTIETKSDWEWCLDVIDNLPHKTKIHEGVANLVAHGFQKFHDAWDEKMIDRAAFLIDRAWDLCRSTKSPTDESYGDWLTTAINHVGGWIGEFWVHYCSHLRQRAGETWQGIPQSLQLRIRETLHGTSRTNVHARIALTPWIGFFFAWDREFAVDYLLPLLDWQRDPIVAQQSWSVLLNYKRKTSKEMELQLIPFYRQYAERVTAMLIDATEKSDQFDRDALYNLGSCLAALAIHVIPDPVDSGFFRDFLPLLPDEVRGFLAAGVGTQLEDLEDDELKHLWDKWLKRYLDLRLLGIPLALSTTETKHMLEWCLHLGPVFTEAVDRITQMPQKSVEAYGILNELAQSPVLVESPLAACRLAIAAMQAEDYTFLNDSHLTLHERFKDTIRRHPEFLTFEELLFRRGWKRS